MLTQTEFPSGSMYNHWLSGLSVMLEKNEGDIRLEKLRATVYWKQILTLEQNYI